MPKRTTVTTKYGKYVGKEDECGVIGFLGIPYARDPERWIRAELPEPSNETCTATEFGPACPQPIFPEEYPFGDPTMSEKKCLNLNIWTADTEVKNKPVMVWIHGGSYVSGSNCVPSYTNEKFVAGCPDILIVNINYRLNAFGSMDLSSFDSKGVYKDSPSIQTLDQMLALQWVYENIEAFGGDPQNITVFGQSAGSFSTSTLLLIPEANMYMKKAICESSGYCYNMKTASYSKWLGERFAETAGVDTLDGLLSLSAEQLLAAAEKHFFDPECRKAYEPLRDGKLIPLEPYKALRSGVAKHVTLMSGSVSGEYDTAYFGAGDEDIKVSTLGLFGDRLNEEVFDKYVENYERRDKREAYLDLRNDLAIRMPVLCTNEAQNESGAETYMYYLDYRPDNITLRSQHCFEIPFFNDKLEIPFFMDERTKEPVQGFDPAPKLQKEIQGIWANFARTGNPGGGAIGIPWPKYNLQDKATMVLTNDGWGVVNHLKTKDTELVQGLMDETLDR